MSKPIKVVELFAGVGGFRLAAEKTGKPFEFIWANQWEPNRKIQYAFDCYQKHFGISDNHSNKDIAIAKETIPKKFDLLVGGFPCQDYSVATTKAKGIEGIKGVLWWDINWIITNRKPKYVLLENVDRLLKSPAKQRGRDFAIILKCFDDNGYNVEWMVNNGSDFGFPQRRKRVFVFAYRKSQKKQNIFKRSFDFKLIGKPLKININTYYDLQDVSDNYVFGKFLEYGEMNKGKINTSNLISQYEGPYIMFKDILAKGRIDKDLLLNNNQYEKIEYYKSHKRIKRYKVDGTPYNYSEGKMILYDDVNKAARTMLTSEGTSNRSTHIIKTKLGPRFLSPIECERLNGFDDNWTEGMPRRVRYFTMGNALIVGVVAKIMENIN
ncbi:MAG: DNA (cytosine-5-)-methyltransferase [Metamycoplasmataceae bacterium]